jgi:hypothetical protein
LKEPQIFTDLDRFAGQILRICRPVLAAAFP